MIANAPETIWADRVGLADLRQRQLIKGDDYGGISLLPMFRELIYDEIPQDQRQEFHRMAAVSRGGLAQYTAALHHLVRAGEIEPAIRLWSSVQDAEIAQGNARAAFNVLSEIAEEDAGRLMTFALNMIERTLQAVLKAWIMSLMF